MKVIRTGDDAFESFLGRIKLRGKAVDGKLWETVREICSDVAAEGDQALFRYTEKFDGYRLEKDDIAVSNAEWEEAASLVAGDDLEILK
ncbi:MAG: histidinol dehydrogenase, partial [Smithellaceae bacterium]|nr:histidinol dehydrogenase [Smithellaceae bacterium]